jgi:hypothetical protein
MKLARQAGSREPRYAHLLAGEVETAEPLPPPPMPSGPAPEDRIAALEAELAALRREFDEFRKRFE